MWYIILSIILASVILVIVLLVVITISYGLYKKSKLAKCDAKKRLDGKTCLVTGGSAGMGLEIAKEFASRGAKVIIACPFEDEGNAAETTIIKTTCNDNVEFKLLNLASFASVREFADDILNSENRLDILMNNAGVIRPDKLTADGINFVLQVNYFGHFLLTMLLLPLLKRTGTEQEKSRIINVSSLSHSLGDVDLDDINKLSMRFKSYFNSKQCVTIFTKELAKKLNDRNVTVNTADPGMAATNIADGFGKAMLAFKASVKSFYPSAWDGAQTSLHVALSAQGEESNGEYFFNCKLSKASTNTEDEEFCNRLWKVSEQLVRLSEKEVQLALDI